MKCKQCNHEMYVIKVDTTDDAEIFRYKCSNTQCGNFGYVENEKYDEDRQNYVNQKLQELKDKNKTGD